MSIDQPTAPATKETTSASSPWRRRRMVIIGAPLAVVGAGVGIGIAASGSGAGSIQIHGVIALGPLAATDSASTTPADGDPCTAAAGYTDITAGAAVVIGNGNGNGQTIGTGGLQPGIEANVDDSAGTPLGNCAFQFSVTVPGGEGTYTVTVSHRGTQTLTPSQVSGGVLLTLGD